MHMKSERPASPDQSTSGFFYKSPKKLSPKEKKDIFTEKVSDKGHEYTISEKEPVVISNNRNVIRSITLREATPSLLEITLDEKVRSGKVGLIHVAVERLNDIRERVQNIQPLALKIVNDSQNLRIVRVEVLNPEKSADDINLFLSLLVNKGYLSETTAETVVSLLGKQTESSLTSSS